MASFGGGEANVAVSPANFGLKVDYVTRLPKNDIAESCLKHTISGDLNLVTVKEVETLMGRDASGQV